MRALKVLSISIIATVIAIFATMDGWQEPTDIHVTFNSESTKDFKYQIFYIDKQGDKFNGDQSVKKVISSGLNQVKIVLPTEKIVQFRIDFGSYPGTVYISDLKVVGDKKINILGDKEENYWFSPDVDEHQFIDGRALRIVSDKGDPYMVYKEKLDVTKGTIINWSKLLQIALSTFFIILLLGLLMTRKKAEKMEEKSPKNKK